jgi:kumamolisin
MPALSFPGRADDQNVVSVGGTHLVTDGAGGPWQSETAWADSGGGISLNGVAIPDWQKNRKVVNHTNSTSRTLRNAPDIAAEADFDNWICADNTCNGTWGGTSFAAPRWAGYIALANQKAVQLGESELGFINPRLYQAAEGRYANNFHDITVGSNGYPAVTGFDLVTGWGSMNGPTLINTLLRP